jgi:protein O-GlcNAc transferase
LPGPSNVRLQTRSEEALQTRFKQGVALYQQGKLVDAERISAQVLRQQPNHFDALHLLGVIAVNTQRMQRAVDLISKAIGLNTMVAEAHFNLGFALSALQRPADAVASFDKAIALQPDHAVAHNARGNALQELKRYGDALISFDKAIALKPDYFAAHNNRGNALWRLKRSEEALASFDRAIALESDLAEAYNNRGNALRDLKRPEDALASFDKAIALKPDYAVAHNNRGNVLRDLNRYADAYLAYDKVLGFDPDCVGAEGMRLHFKMHGCDWSNLDAECAHLISSVQAGKVNTTPFPFLTISSSPDDQLKCAKLWISNNQSASDRPVWQGERYDHSRIRIAYVSGDFHDHPMAFLMAGLFEGHDRNKFETFALSYGPDSKGATRTRLKAAFDRFIDVRESSDRDVAMLIGELEIDIAVDRKGFTTNGRSEIFAFRPAPIQVNYLAYPGTMGAEYIDYILADRVVIPEEHRRYYSEKVVYLPDSYQANDSKRFISKRTPTRPDLGLPVQGFVFCCFNSNYKLTPRIFDCWMRILKQVEGSVLWLLEDNATAASNLRKEAMARGVSAERLIFANRMPHPDHLARHRLADLFLDTLPYNAHTTASDALWADLPVITCLGETFAGRVAASLLNAIHLPELITTTLETYERIAIDIATHPEKLATIKHRLARNRLAAPLFDTKNFTQHIEAAYTAMYKRHQAGLAPEHFSV